MPRTLIWPNEWYGPGYCFLGSRYVRVEGSQKTENCKMSYGEHYYNLSTAKQMISKLGGCALSNKPQDSIHWWYDASISRIPQKANWFPRTSIRLPYWLLHHFRATGLAPICTALVTRTKLNCAGPSGWAGNAPHQAVYTMLEVVIPRLKMFITNDWVCERKEQVHRKTLKARSDAWLYRHSSICKVPRGTS